MPNASGLLRAHYAKSLSTKASSTSEAVATQALKAKRPLSPHLQIYEPQLTWVMSIAHRFTGAGLAAGVYAGGIWYAVAPFASTAVVSSVAAIPGVLLFSGKFLLSASYSYHFWNGIRHLLWDVRYGLSLKSVYATGYAVSGATLLSSLWLALL
jgi:succinate dehydrogenase (ubiquinone) cytochrome b560 subunit